MPPDGRPTRAAAHGRVPARPGEPRRPCSLRAQEKVERRRLHVGRATRDLGMGCTGAPGELAAQTRSRSPDLAVRKRAPKDPSTPPGRDRAEPARRGAPGAGGGWLPGRAEVRQGCYRRADAASPGARAGLTAVTEAPTGRGLEARARGRGGPQGRLPHALDRPHSRRRCRFRPRALRCHEPEGGNGAGSLRAQAR